MRHLVTALVVSGCGFSLPAGTATGDDDPQPDARPMPADGAEPVARSCEVGDASVRLCIDFDDQSDLVSDGSSYANSVAGEQLVAMTRATQGAVQMSIDSKLLVAETPSLDIPDELTVSLWTRVDLGDLPLTGAHWLFDNNNQYFAQLRGGGMLRCGSGNITVDGASVLGDSQWHHVACTYEDDSIRLYVDGDVVACREMQERPIPTNGTDGFAVGGNLMSGGVITERFVGGIDNVQVFARELSSEELCAAAGRTQCTSRCPGSNGGGQGGPGGF